MKTKTIPFNLEMAKKIQAGEIEGIIKTRDGERVMRIVCYESTARFLNTIQPIIAQNIEECEEFFSYFKDGAYLNGEKHKRDLVLEIPDNEPQEPQELNFKPFDKVLCRDYDDDEWILNLFSHEGFGLSYPYYMCGGRCYKQCIPYEGNENLLGTTDEPREE